jgi:hypothetical protein
MIASVVTLKKLNFFCNIELQNLFIEFLPVGDLFLPQCKE